MSHRLLDVDATQPLADVQLDDGVDGLGLLLRDGSRPVGWRFVDRTGEVLTAAELEQHAVLAAGPRLLEERLRAELLDRLVVPAASPSAPPNVTVAVCTRNRPDDLARCLDSIAVAVAAYPGDADVLVVDNAPSDDHTRDEAAGRAGVRYAREPVAGLDVARNRALREAAGAWLAFVDDDVRVDPGWLRGLATALEEHPDAAAVTGLVLPAQLETEAQLRFELAGGFGRGFAQQRWDGRHGPGSPLHPLGAGVFGAGCNMAFHVETLRGLGGFDEALDTGPPLPGGGDLDAFYCVLAAGRTLVYEPTMTAFHRHRRELDELRSQYYSWGTGFAAFLGARWRDPQERPQVARTALWWLGYQRRQVTVAARRRDALGRRLALAELRGGLAGAVGGYRRSQARMTARGAAPGRALPPTTASPAAVPAAGPVVLRHVDLRAGLPLPGTGSGAAGRWYLWWGSLPLGVLHLEPWQLPVTPRRLARLVAAATVDAVGDQLHPDGLFAAALPYDRPGAPASVPALTALLEGSVLDRLEQAAARARRPEGVATAAVVVCTRNRPELLRRCLESVLRLDRAPDEVLVVDNAREDDATRQVARDLGVRYVEEPRPGLSRARNTGIEATTSDVVAFTDDDVVVHPTWLDALLAGFTRPEVMAVTGLVLPSSLEGTAEQAFEDAVGGFGQGYRQREFGHEWLLRHRRRTAHVWKLGAGASAAFRRSAFDRVGGFDERLGAGAAGCSEDSEMWHRLLAGGWRCRYEPSAVVHHAHRPSLAALQEQSRAYLRGHVAALAVQWSHTRQVGEPRRALVTLPRYLARRAAAAAVLGRPAPTLAAEVRGYVGGLLAAAPMTLSPAPVPVPPGPRHGPVVKSDLGAFLATNPFPHPRTLGLFYAEKMRAIHAVSPARGVERVLEVGGGQSGLAAALYPSARVLTVDLDPAFGARHDLFDGSRHAFLCADATRLPVPDGCMDVVTLFDVAEHVPDDRAALQEALRVLRPGGHLLLTTPSELWRFPYYGAYRRWTPTDLDVMAEWGHVRPGYRVAELDGLVGRAHDQLATFITPVSVVAHDVSFSLLRGRVKRLAGLALAPVVLPVSRLHRPHGAGTEIALRWTLG